MEEIVYNNRLFEVTKQEIFRKARKFNAYSVISHDEVTILPFIDKNHILLEKQYRYPVKKNVYELPAGHIEKGEKPIDAAKRELEEETAHKSSNLKLIATYYPSPGILSAIGYIYVATNMKKGKLSLDIDEQINLKKTSFDSAVKMVKTGKIIDAKSVIAILYYQKFKSGKSD